MAPTESAREAERRQKKFNRFVLEQVIPAYRRFETRKCIWNSSVISAAEKTFLRK